MADASHIAQDEHNNNLALTDRVHLDVAEKRSSAAQTLSVVSLVFALLSLAIALFATN